MTDYWRPYKQFVPASLHTQSKAETYTAEGYNSLLRDGLARLKRKTKCYLCSVGIAKAKACSNVQSNFSWPIGITKNLYYFNNTQ